MLLSLTLLPLLSCTATPAPAQTDIDAALKSGTPVIAPDAYLTAPYGLERTDAKSEIIPVSGQPFAKALRVVIGKASPETNYTQLTMNNAAPVEKGDVLLASFYVHGRTTSGDKPARMGFLFEKAVDPWTKSVAQDFSAAGNATRWRRVVVPFVAAESYAPGQVMTSLRFAFGPQTVEIGGLQVVNFGASRKLEDLNNLAVSANLLGEVNIKIALDDVRQTLIGFGGNFCQPRYGQTEAMDAVGQYVLSNLDVAHARVGLPLNYWTPEKGVYKDDAQARAAMTAMQLLTKRQIPIVLTVWEGPTWMLPGTPEQGRVLPKENYAACIEAVAQFLVTARDKYGATAEYFSFNEADYGVNFKFSSAEIADFYKQAGKRFTELGLKTKFLVADTANGANLVAYARPLLEDKELAPLLGPIAFHSWDSLSVADSTYAAIGALGKEFNKPVWCTEAGHDAGLWQKPNPWASWENALRTAQAYAKTLSLTRASLMDYWTYQDNYPLVLVNGNAKTPYPVFQVIKQMGEALLPDSRIVSATADSDDVQIVAVRGPKAGYFSALLVNPIGAGKAILSGLPANQYATVFLSDATGQRKTVTTPTIKAIVSKDGKLTIALPARSVVTVFVGR